jgi:hypothetical protein
MFAFQQDVRAGKVSQEVAKQRFLKDFGRYSAIVDVNDLVLVRSPSSLKRRRINLVTEQQRR